MPCLTLYYGVGGRRKCRIASLLRPSGFTKAMGSLDVAAYCLTAEKLPVNRVPFPRTLVSVTVPDIELPDTVPTL